jgi:hypothetical protein
MEVRKYITVLEEIHSDGGRKMDPPGKRAAAIAVIKSTRTVVVKWTRPAKEQQPLP